MNMVSMTLNIVCLLFYFLLIFVYFNKKTAKNIDNRIYRYILLCNFMVIISDILFLVFCFYFPNNLSLIAVVRRANVYFILLFLIFILSYSILIATEKRKKVTTFLKEHEKLVLRSLFGFLVLLAVIEVILPLEFHYNDSGIVDYVMGPATNDFVSFIVLPLLIFFAFPIILINWKQFDKKKMQPILIVTILELITLVVNNQNPSLCLASISITITSHLMYHTLENPDIKIIAELELAKNQAIQASNAKTDFLSSMSHEIRTPLNAIVGLSEMVRTSDNLEEIHEDTADILLASQNLLEIVNGILDINKIEANKMDIIESNYSPMEVFNELVKLIKARIGEKPLAFRTYFSPNIPQELYGDRDKIKRIIINLLTNAVKYTEKGSIDLIVDCVNEKDENNVGISKIKITVKDTGRGIKQEQIKYLFNKFYRLEEDKDSDIEGTGLGLAITKSLIELMDGKITVDSIYGEGSTFTVLIGQKIVTPSIEQSEQNTNVDNITKLNTEDHNVELTKNNTLDSNVVQKAINDEVPNVNNNIDQTVINKTVSNDNSNLNQIKTTNIVSNVNNTNHEEVNTQSSNIPTENTILDSTSTQHNDLSKIIEEINKKIALLVVDDNKLNLKVASKTLQEYNFDIEIANSGFECLDKVQRNNKYAIIFMDIMMPNMNGIETLHKLRSMKNFDIPVIALTADAMGGNREKYIEVGFDEFLPKPIDKKLLEEILNKYIGISNKQTNVTNTNTTTNNNINNLKTTEEVEII